MLRLIRLIPFLVIFSFAQENPDSAAIQVDTLSAVEQPADTSMQDSLDVAPVAAMTQDSAGRQNWIAEWWGEAKVASIKPTWKFGDYDAKNLRIPFTATVKEGKFEFGISGAIPMLKESAEKFRKSKGWKTQVLFHDREIRLQPKKKESRYVVIDAVQILWDSLTVPTLAEIWIPQKITTSAGYKVWKDSLVAQKSLTTAVRSWVIPTPGELPLAMLRLGGIDWLSSYAASITGFSYACAQTPEHLRCRKYSRDALEGVCPQGMVVPDTNQIRSLMNAWHGTSDTVAQPMPFQFTLRAWEITEADSTSKNKGRLLLTPWTGNGQIEPHFWTYLETYVRDAAGGVGLFQLGWSETGWMTELDMDASDPKMHPVRCVKGEIQAPKETVVNPVLEESAPN